MPEGTKNFNVSEFSCHCGCGFNIIDQRVINMAQIIRDELGVPVHVNSGCRCKTHNARVGGVKESYHMQGLAADLSCTLGGRILFTAIANLKAKMKLPDMQYAIWYMRNVSQQFL